MGLLRWLTQNSADTDIPTHRDLFPLRLTGRRGEALLLVSYEIDRLPRWHIEATEGRTYSIRATRRSGFGAVYDVTLKLTSDKGETWLHAASRARRRGGDFGRSRRNLLELFAALRKSGVAEKEKKKK